MLMDFFSETGLGRFSDLDIPNYYELLHELLLNHLFILLIHVIHHQ
jgi:hypothetical protein